VVDADDRVHDGARPQARRLASYRMSVAGRGGPTRFPLAAAAGRIGPIRRARPAACGDVAGRPNTSTLRFIGTPSNVS
jgi:hypothetical protein